MILERYYDEFWMKMKIIEKHIRSILMFNKKHIVVSIYQLKTRKDNDFWF